MEQTIKRVPNGDLISPVSSKAQHTLMRNSFDELKYTKLSVNAHFKAKEV